MRHPQRAGTVAEIATNARPPDRLRGGALGFVELLGRTLGVQLGLYGAGLLRGLAGCVRLCRGIGGEAATLGRFGVQAVLLAL